MSLTPNDRDLLALLARSPKNDEGWAKVSDIVLPLIKEAPAALVEIKTEAGNHFARFTEEGELVFSWL